MQFLLAIHQSAPRGGAFSENASRIIATLHNARQYDANLPLILFAPRCALEGLEGRSALKFDFVRRARDSALNALNEESRNNKALIYMPIETESGPVAVVLGRNSVPLEFHGYKQGSDSSPSLEPSVSLDQDEHAMLVWDPFKIREPYCTKDINGLIPSPGSVFVSPSLGGCESQYACAGASTVAFGEHQYTARRYEPDALAFVCDTNADRLVDVAAPIRLIDENAKNASLPDDDRLAAIIAAVRDYVSTIHAEGVVLGISGGVDSALVAACAVEALGADRVRSFFLPSRFSSPKSLALAQCLAKGLGLNLVIRSIERMHAAALSDFSDDIGELPIGDITDQNIQARLRSLRLMAIANKENRIQLCTANKAESSMGYGTLYGDLAGGFAPIADLWKSEVVALCRHFNKWKGSEIIPEAIIEREPTAELRPGQKDSDSIPLYDEIERVMRAALNRDFDPSKFSTESLDIVKKAIGFAFKRHQCAIGLRLSPTTLSDFDQCFGINRTLEWAKSER